MSGSGSGFAASVQSPSGNYCLWYGFDFLCTSGYTKANTVDFVIRVTIGTGDQRITVLLSGSTQFYFDVTGIAGSSDEVKISGLSAMSSSSWAGSGSVDLNQNVCAYRSNAAGTYDLSVSGVTISGSDFVLQKGGDALPVTLYWNNAASTTGRTALTVANPSTRAGVTGANTEDENCSTGGRSANFSLIASESDLQSVPAGTYTGTVSITVAVPD
jgi:hypothetical protein